MNTAACRWSLNGYGLGAVAPVMFLVATVLLTGCSGDPAFTLNSVYLRKAEKELEVQDEVFRYDEQHRRDIADILVGLFGTPDDPHFPQLPGIDVTKVVDRTRLVAAGGPVRMEAASPAGLFREHCAHCHGITGDGRGPTAQFLNPYPRDFRKGVFKFKSTPKGIPPTHDDLKRILINGVANTAMPAFRLLSEPEIEALVHYVKYLSVRGQVERRLIEALADLDETEQVYRVEVIKGGKTLVVDVSDSGNVSNRFEQFSADRLPSEVRQGLEKLLVGEDAEIVSAAEQPGSQPTYRVQVTDRGKTFDLTLSSTGSLRNSSQVETEERKLPKMIRDAVEEDGSLKGGTIEKTFLVNVLGDRLIDVSGKGDPKMDYSSDLAFVNETVTDIVTQWQEAAPTEIPPRPSSWTAANHAQIVREGRDLFFGTRLNCVQCHGETALGDALEQGSGETSTYDDWTEDWRKAFPNSIDEFVREGAHPPRMIKPRNLRLGVYRGGHRPIDLFWRIRNGIDGTPMPGQPQDKVSDEEVWKVIAYVRNLPFESLSRPRQSQLNEKEVR